MPRVDVWDLPDPDQQEEAVWCGYARNLTELYESGPSLGEGGFGTVKVVRLRSNGKEYACKSIAKSLAVPNLAPAKKQQHIQSIQREIAILRKLRGTLNVVALEDVFEDATHVHIVMEYCRGGELFHRIGKRHYSEKTVASYMRAVLRILAQCHAHRILHRDIKPGNFMLLTEADDSPLKAIDFGLAVFFDPKQLPRTDLGLEGTPWYMAPEVLSSSVLPASDVWSAGVMAYQLLSGRFPFDDWSNPKAPALSLVWRSILSEEPDFKRNVWDDISEQAKDFCRMLLKKDPNERASAKEALAHPWLQGRVRQRTEGKQLGHVVQRLQRFAQQNAFKRTILDMIANELIRRHLEAQDAAQAAAAAASGSVHGGSMHDGRQSVESVGAGSMHGGVAGSAGSLADRMPRESLEGSVHNRLVGGSMRSGMSAMDALRRARERKSYAESLSALAKDPSQHGPAYGTSPSTSMGRLLRAPPLVSSPEPSSYKGPVKSPEPSSYKGPVKSPEPSSYKGPVKDPGAVAWDFNYMAHRLSMEGSAHGNPQAARLLRMGSPGLPAVPDVRMEGTWHGPATGNIGAGAATADHSWHGPDRKSARATAEFQRFLEQSRRQRNEQRKVARLVLETSTHGGHSYMSPEELEERQQAQQQQERRRQQQQQQGRGGAAASTSSEQLDKSGSLIGKLKGSLSGVKRALGSWSSSSDAGSSHGGTAHAAGAGSAGGSLAAISAPPAPGLPLLTPVTSSVADLARNSPLPLASLAPQTSSVHVRSASDLPIPSPCEVAGAAKEAPSLLPKDDTAPAEALESGKRGHGAYAALMAKGEGAAPAPARTSSVPPTVGSTSPSKPQPLQQAAEQPQRQTERPPPLPPLPQQQQQQQQPESQPAAEAPLRPLSAPRHVGWAEPEPAAKPQGRPVSRSEPGGPPLRPLSAPKHVGWAEPVLETEPLPQPQASTVNASEPGTAPAAALRPLSAPKHVGYAQPEAAPAPKQLPPPSASVPIPGKQQREPDRAPGHTSGIGNEPGASISGEPGATPFAVATGAAKAAAGTSGISGLAAPGGMPAELREVLERLHFFDKRQAVTYEELQQQLAANGYRLLPGEVAELMQQITLGGQSGMVERSQLVASQIEWETFQVNHRDEWLDCLRTTFEGLDGNKDGRISVKDMMKALASKLPQEEVNAAIEDVLLEAAAEEDEGLDFAAFTALVQAPSQDSLASLDQYDARMLNDGSTPDGTAHGADGVPALQRLEVLSE